MQDNQPKGSTPETMTQDNRPPHQHPDGEKSTTSTATETTSETPSESVLLEDIDAIVEQMCGPDEERLRALLLNPDAAPAARACLEMMRPFNKWLLQEHKRGTEVDALLNAYGQFIGNAVVMLCDRTIIKGQRKQAMAHVVDSMIATIGALTTKKSGLIVPD